MRNLNNRIYDAFDSIHAGQDLKGKTTSYLSRASGRRKSGVVRYAAAAACLLFVLLGGMGYQFYMTPVAAISIDVNPSMEWEVNRLDRVVSVICYNQEAEDVAAKLRLKHRKYDDAINELLTSSEMSVYLAENDEVSISVAAEDEARSIRIQDRVAECAGRHCSNVSCHGGTESDRQAANEAGVSLGKYEAFLALRELNPAITLEEVSGLCMCEIQNLIREYGGQDAETDQTGSGHTGRGHCHGKDGSCQEEQPGQGEQGSQGAENRNSLPEGTDDIVESRDTTDQEGHHHNHNHNQNHGYPHGGQ